MRFFSYLSLDFLFVVLASGACLADKLKGAPVSQNYTFGPLQCFYKQSQAHIPETVFECNLNKKSVFKLKFGAEEIISSNDNRFIMGLSNSGRHKVDFWIVDSSGSKIVESNFYNKRIHFCDMTISAVRHWYKKGSKPKFIVKNGKLVDVVLVGCDGKKVSLSNISKFAVKDIKTQRKRNSSFLEKIKNFFAIN